MYFLNITNLLFYNLKVFLLNAIPGNQVYFFLKVLFQIIR